MKKPVKIILYILIALVVVAIIIYPQLKNEEQSEVVHLSKGKKELAVEVEIVNPKPLAEQILSVGSILPDEIVALTFEAAGKVIAINFKEGEMVKKGTLLAQINDAPLQAELKRLQAELPILTNRELRKKELLKSKAISQDEYDQAQTDLNKLLADIELVNANIDKCQLIAPFDGKIGLRQLSEGTYANINTEVAILAKLNPLKIEFSYPEQYASQVKKGTHIVFKTSDAPTTYNAQIYAVESTVNDVTKSLTARALYHNLEEALYPGRFVSVEINLSNKEDALTISSQAVTMEMGKAFVYKYKNGIAQKQEILIGIRNEKELEVLSGIAAGDTIITTGILQVRPNSKVKIAN